MDVASRSDIDGATDGGSAACVPDQGRIGEEHLAACEIHGAAIGLGADWHVFLSAQSGERGRIGIPIGARLIEGAARAGDIDDGAALGNDVAGDRHGAAREDLALAPVVDTAADDGLAGGVEDGVCSDVDARDRLRGEGERTRAGDADVAAGSDDPAEHGGGLTAEGDAAEAVGDDGGTLTDNEIAPHDGEAAVERIARSGGLERKTHRGAESLGFGDTGEVGSAAIDGVRDGDVTIDNRLQFRVADDMDARSRGREGGAGQSHAAQREGGESTLAQERRIEVGDAGRGTASADLEGEGGEIHGAAAGSGVAAEAASKEESPTESLGDVEILSGGDREGAGVAIGGPAAGAELNAARDIDEGIASEADIESGNGDGAAGDARGQQGRATGAVVDDESGGAQGGAPTEREASAPRLGGRSHPVEIG